MTSWSLPDLPYAEPVRFKRNLLQKVVCEVKFPTLYGLDPKRPPAAFANALRRAYSEHGVAKNVNVGPTGVSEDFSYVFRDKKTKSSVSMSSSSIGVETAAYVSFEEFSMRVVAVVAAARSTIDADFFTRVGLRYINVLPFSQSTVSEWINPLLVAPLASGIFGDVQESNGRFAGENESGGFGFAHGIGMNTETRVREYVLDLDFYRYDIEIKNVEDVLQRLHDEEFRMFRWALGPAALEHMGPATPKKRSK